MKYFYIHGWGAAGETTVKRLKEVIDEEITILKWDCQKPFNENYDELFKFMKEEKAKGECVLMGSSMGGYYANAIASELCIHCALFNPVYDPKEVLKRFQKDAPALITDELINSYSEVRNRTTLRLVIIGKNDEVLDSSKSINYWKHLAGLMEITEDAHEIKDFKPFKKDFEFISKYVNFDDM